jgi:hypothetical protein
MSVLARVNLSAQQRWDLHHKLMEESFIAFDFRALISSIVGDDAFIVRGFEVVGKSGLSATLRIANAFVFNPQDNNGSMFYGLSNETDVALALPANQANTYIEAKFVTETGAPVNSAFWDALSLTGEDASGSQYTAAADSQNVLVLEISANTTQFTPGSIPLAWASTNANSITSLEDRRNMFGRLGRGGDAPDPLYKFPWATNRGEPVPSGTGVGQATDSPWRSQTATGALNDKAFKSLKDVIDAILTRFCDITGSSLWYTSGLSSSPSANVSINQTYFDTLGHNIQPSANSSFIWKKVSGTLRLAGEGTVPVDGGSGTHLEGLVRWQSNSSKLEWHLGGTFTSGFRTYQSGQVRFTSPAPDDKGNVYLYLEREVSKGSGASVSWADNTQETSFLSSKAVSGQPGDFDGIALGDFIRKDSEGYSRYYRVVKMSDGTTIFNNATPVETSKIADNTIVALELEDTIASGASTETLKYFRARYSDADLFSDTNISTNGYLYQDTNFYWLGRRVGDLFYLRNYGTMQEGEEVTTLNDAWSGLGGNSDTLVAEHAKEAVYDSTNGYSLKTGAGTLLTLRRRKRDNTLEAPGAGDNSGSLLTYTITAPVGLIPVGSSLWVRLSDTTSAALVNGSVTNSTDDLGNTDISTNRWEVRTSTNAPLRTKDNQDVFLVARRTVIAGQDSIIFFDGSVLGDYGNLTNQNLEITGETKLTPRPNTSVLFISDTIAGQIDDDSTQLYYNKTTGTFRFRTFLAEDNDISLTAPASVNLFTNLGQNSLVIGSADSTIFVPGDLIVAGNTIAAQVSQVMVEDKLITLGIGNLSNQGYNAGVEVADNTISSNQMDSTNGDPDVVIELNSAPGYSLGDMIGVSSIQDVGGITAGQISGEYEIVAALTTAGEATISGTTLTIRTASTATSTATESTDTPIVYKSEWAIKVSGSDGSIAGITSWKFQVKGVATTPTVTPVSGYGIVPTANSTGMLSTRIPFVANDNSGPAGVDSTLDFSSNFAWDNVNQTLNIAGQIATQGFRVNYGTTQTANYTALATDHVIPVDTSAAVSPVTVTLPAAAAGNKGQIYIIKDVGGACHLLNKSIIIAPTGGNTLDGTAASITMTIPRFSLTFISNGSNGWTLH